MGGDRLHGCVVCESRGIVSLFFSPLSLPPLSLSLLLSLCLMLPHTDYSLPRLPSSRCVALYCAALYCAALRGATASRSAEQLDTHLGRRSFVLPVFRPARQDWPVPSGRRGWRNIYSDIQWLEKSISAQKLSRSNFYAGMRCIFRFVLFFFFFCIIIKCVVSVGIYFILVASGILKNIYIMYIRCCL